MKTTTNKKTISKVELLEETIRMRRELEKLERSLKSELYDLLGESPNLKAGNFLVIVSERERTDINRDKVKIILGDKYDEVLDTKKYKQLDVRVA